MSKFTDEQQAAVEAYKAEVLRVARQSGYSNEAAAVLAKVDRAFRDPHAADSAAEGYLIGLPSTVYTMVDYSKREEARAILKDTFAAGWDARGSQDAAESESEQSVPAQVAEAQVAEESKRRWF